MSFGTVGVRRVIPRRVGIRTGVKLRIGEQPDEMRPIPRRDMVPLQMPRNVLECLGVPVDVERARSMPFLLVL